jgi:hypothetical protein
MKKEERKTYTVFGVIQVQVFVEVKAKSEEEALKKAKKLDNTSFQEGDWLSSPQEDLEVRQ